MIPFKAKPFQRLLLISLMCLSLVIGNAYAGEEEYRAWIGLGYFPSLLAADLNITEKKHTDGQLHLLFIYVDKKKMAEKMAKSLKSKVKTIADMEIHIEAVQVAAVKDYKETGGIFFTQKITDNLEMLIRYAKDNHIIVFSPFKGDVAQGVSGGIFITNRVYPYINMDAMDMAGINIKPLFRKIAKCYGKKCPE